MAITIDNSVRLPVNVERGASGGPLFDTIVQRTDGGRIETNVNWAFPLYGWDVGYGIQTPTDFNSVRDVFIGARGQAYGFRFKDWGDYIMADQTIGTGDSADAGATGTDTFQIYKRYSTAARNLDRVITWAQERLGRQYLVDGALSGAHLAETRAPQVYGIKALSQLDSQL